MLENWPPAKGPKPKELDRREVYLAAQPVRRDFKFKLPAGMRAERGALLSAVLEHHHDKSVEEKVGAALIDGADARYESVVRSGKFRYTTERVFEFNHSIEVISRLKVEEASRAIQPVGARRGNLESEIQPRQLRVRLTYPLTTGVELLVRPMKIVDTLATGKVISTGKRMTLGYLAWAIAMEYRRIYIDWKQYGVWGHGIEDLYLERVKIKKGGRAEVFVGS